MKFTFVSLLITSIFGLSLTQANAPAGGVTNTGANSAGVGGAGTNGANTGTKNNDGTQGFNQGYSYNTGIRPYQTGFTFYQPFGDDANKQTTAPIQTTGVTTGAAPAPVAAAQPVAPAGYQPQYNAFSPPVAAAPAPVAGQPVAGQPIQYQNVPQFVHYGPPPPQGVAQPIAIQPIQLSNFDAAGIPLFDSLDLGAPIQPVQNNNVRRNRNNNNANQIPALGGDFDIPVLGGGGGNRNRGGNGFFNPPSNNDNDFGFPSASNGGGFFGPATNNNNNNDYDNLPDDQSLANFANLGGGGGQSNDYPDNGFGNLGDFGSATQNRGTFDLLPNLGDGFFRRK